MKNLIIKANNTSIEALEIGGSFVLRWDSLCQALGREHYSFRRTLNRTDKGYVIRKLFRFIDSDGVISKVEYSIGLLHALRLVGSLPDQSVLYQKLLDLKSGKCDSIRYYSGPCKLPRRSLTDLVSILDMSNSEE